MTLHSQDRVLIHHNRTVGSRAVDSLGREREREGERERERERERVNK